MENAIKQALSKQLETNKIEEIVSVQFEKALEKTVESLFRWGEVNKLLEEKIKSVLIPMIEGYDYSDYVLKLDVVLQEILKQTAVPHKELLENFKELMLPVDTKEIKVSELFARYCEYVAKNVDTSELKVEFEDEPMYEGVCVECVYEKDNRSWSSREIGVLKFRCGQDEQLNFSVPVCKWDFQKFHEIELERPHDFHSIRQLNAFELLLMKLFENRTHLLIDGVEFEEMVEPVEKPEATYS